MEVVPGGEDSERIGRSNPIKAIFGNTTTVYIGNYYERDNGTTVRKYYYAGGVRVAMRSGSQTYYLLGDHLTSTAVTLDSAGNRLNSNTELRYSPYGAARYDTANQQTLCLSPYFRRLVVLTKGSTIASCTRFTLGPVLRGVLGVA